MSQTKVNRVTVRSGSALVCEGNITVLDSEGNEILNDTEAWLCRCGVSKNKPFCDGSHNKCDFDEGRQSLEQIKTEEINPDSGDKLVVTVRSNAMLLAKGPMEVYDQDGNLLCTRNKAAFCRCGASMNKPFCDSMHKECGFSDN